MSKLNGGLFSKSRGKVAGVVTQQYDGLQVAKEYQPVVKNPRTQSQTDSRMKFKLASQITGLYGDFLNLLQKANGIQYTRFQRGETLRAFYRNIAITELDGDNAAVLSGMPRFRSASSTSQDLTGLTITQGEGGMYTMTLTRSSSEGGANAIVRLVQFNGDGSIGRSTFNLTFADGSTTATQALTAGEAGAQFTAVGVLIETSSESTADWLENINGIEGSVALWAILSQSDTILYSNSVEVMTASV